MAKQTVYIAGRVTGIPHAEAFSKFRIKQLELEAEGFQVVNPMLIVEKDTEWNTAMRSCIINMLLHADIICLLPDWRESEGATLEKHIAEKVGIRIIN